MSKFWNVVILLALFLLIAKAVATEHLPDNETLQQAKPISVGNGPDCFVDGWKEGAALVADPELNAAFKKANCEPGVPLLN